jgi:hypothetical protein
LDVERVGVSCDGVLTGGAGGSSEEDGLAFGDEGDGVAETRQRVIPEYFQFLTCLLVLHHYLSILYYNLSFYTLLYFYTNAILM